MSQDEEYETQQLLALLVAFITKETQILVAKLQELRFENDGVFNDHEAWAPNVRADIIKEKSGKPPLQDTGRLKAQLTDPNNWDLDPQWSGSTLRLNIPDTEDFTDPEYDSLEDESGGSYRGTATGKKIEFKWKPKRLFKGISEQDGQWITDQLEQAIRKKFG